MGILRLKILGGLIFLRHILINTQHSRKNTHSSMVDSVKIGSAKSSRPGVLDSGNMRYIARTLQYLTRLSILLNINELVFRSVGSPLECCEVAYCLVHRKATAQIHVHLFIFIRLQIYTLRPPAPFVICVLTAFDEYAKG